MMLGICLIGSRTSADSARQMFKGGVYPKTSTFNGLRL